MESSETLLAVPTGALEIKDLPGTSNLCLSLVIPTYKEKDNIQKVIHILTQTLNESIPGDYELIVVDDDSPDLTWAIAANLRTDYPRLRVMRRQGEKGLSSAVVRGWQLAEGEILGVIDADLQHPPIGPLSLWERARVRGYS